jgi:hypothetical protein
MTRVARNNGIIGRSHGQQLCRSTRSWFEAIRIGLDLALKCVLLAKRMRLCFLPYQPGITACCRRWDTGPKVGPTYRHRDTGRVPDRPYFDGLVFKVLPASPEVGRKLARKFWNGIYDLEVVLWKSSHGSGADEKYGMIC